MEKSSANEFFELGSNFYQQGNLKEALMYFEKALMYIKESDDNKTANTFLKIAETYTELHDYDKAEENFAQSQRLYSKTKDLIGEGYALTGLGIIQEKKDDYDEARKYFNKAIKKFRKADDSDREGIVISLIASTYEFQGAWEDALMEYEKSSQIFEDHGDSQSKNYINDLAQKVKTKLFQSTVTKKVPFTKKEVEYVSMDKSGGDEFFELGSDFYQQGNLKDALMYFEKALIYFKESDDNKTANTFLKIAETYTELHDYDKAEENFAQSQRLYSKSKDLIGEGYALTGLGIIEEKKDDYDEARKYFNKALKRFRKADDSDREGIVISLIASTYQFQGAWEDALMEYKRSSQIFHETGNIQRELNVNDVYKQVNSKRSKFKVSKKEIGYAIGYFLLLFIAELSITYYHLQAGLTLMCIVLFLLLVHSSLNVSNNFSVLLRSMMALPIIRIVGLSIPLMQVPALYWFPIIAIPLFAASFIIMRIQGLNLRNVGLIKGKLVRGNMVVQVLIALSGLFLGFIEYQILHPKPLIAEFNLLSLFISSFIIIISTGFAEELLFRGIIQKNAENVFGNLFGLIYSAILFTIMHIGWINIYDYIFVFFVAVFYGFAYQKTRSIVGVTFSHGISNSILFLVMPFVVVSF